MTYLKSFTTHKPIVSFIIYTSKINQTCYYLTHELTIQQY